MVFELPPAVLSRPPTLSLSLPSLLKPEVERKLHLKFSPGIRQSEDQFLGPERREKLKRNPGVCYLLMSETPFAEGDEVRIN